VRVRTSALARDVLAAADLSAGRDLSRLVSPAAFGAVVRPALRLPAPASLAFDLDPASCDALRVSLGVLDRGLALREDALLLARGAGDGVTFEVDVEAGGRVVTVFSRHLQPGEGWVDRTVDLSAWTGRDVRLVLRSGAGPDGDAGFDEALWADLTLLGAPAAPPHRPDILLIDVDTLRADRLSTYGHARATAPGLDAWIERWSGRTVVYEDCLATSSWTLPSTMSLLTGLAVRQHGVEGGTQALAPLFRTLASASTRRGTRRWR
jgi:hypothetical protein